MRYVAVALDYDGTLATAGKVPESVLWGLAMLRQSGRQLILVTGRLLPDLLDVFPYAGLFDRVVAENGALLYSPRTRKETALAPPLDGGLVTALAQRGVAPLEHGHAIVATREPHETDAVEVIKELGLEVEVIFNKGAVMMLPSGVNKATGLTAALDELGVSVHNTVAVGDGENDHAFLAACECGVAVAGAVESLRRRADWVTEGDRAEGVVEVVEALLADDLASIDDRLTRHHIALGTTATGDTVAVSPYGMSVLLAGPSGSGKSTLTTALLEGLAARNYQYCVIDPEGDYETLEGAVVLGNQERPPQASETLQLLRGGTASVVVNLIGLKLEDRPLFFEALLPDLMELRTTTGRPHFLVVDEAHHLVPAQWERARHNLPQQLESILFVTVHPDVIAPAVLRIVDVVIAVGDAPGRTFEAFAQGAGITAPRSAVDRGAAGVAHWWRPDAGDPAAFDMVQSRQERRRHVRKYAEGDLGDAFSFYFRGPDDRLNLKAQNLMIFMQLAEGVDDETWVHHLRQGDYSAWFRTRIKDEDLAAAAIEVEQATDLDATESRARMRALIEERYTLPA